MAVLAMRSASAKAQLIFVLILLSSSLSLAHYDEAGHVHEHLEITYGFACPDGVKQQVVLINGEYTGPTIRAVEGDWVHVHVKNDLPTGEGVAIHWHGFTQINTPWMDGVGYVSQCPIEQGETYTYTFLADKSGTYMYHGHYGMHITEGLYGLFIVEDRKKVGRKPYKYDGEISMIVADWWHSPVKDIATDLLTKGSTTSPKAILINGKGTFDGACVLNETEVSTGNFAKSSANFTVTAGKTYRLRIVNAATATTVRLAVDKHNLTVIETDVYYTEKLPVDGLDVYPGQSYSVLFTANQRKGNYWITLNKGSEVNGTAILNYKGINVAPPEDITEKSSEVDSKALAEGLRALKKEAKKLPVPKEAHIKITLVNEKLPIDNKGVNKWCINGVSWREPETPFMLTSYFGLAKPPPPPLAPPPINQNGTYGSSFYEIPLGAVVDFILVDKSGQAHPWHIHGHHFWVIGSGAGEPQPNSTYNLVDPPHRHTTPLFGQGWTTVRFIANNPGHWLFHCHIITHQFLGMGIGFGIGLDKLPPPPDDLQFCGELNYGKLREHGFERPRKNYKY